MNLLERFVLQRMEITRLQGEVAKAAKVPGKQEAKVELNLTPRLIRADSGDQPPSYQVRATLTCRSAMASCSSMASLRIVSLFSTR